MSSGESMMNCLRLSAAVTTRPGWPASISSEFELVGAACHALPDDIVREPSANREGVDRQAEDGGYGHVDAEVQIIGAAGEAREIREQREADEPRPQPYRRAPVELHALGRGTSHLRDEQQ